SNDINHRVAGGYPVWWPIRNVLLSRSVSIACLRSTKCPRLSDLSHLLSSAEMGRRRAQKQPSSPMRILSSLLAFTGILAPAGATTLQRLELDEIIQKSTAIVRAKVLGSAGAL